MRVLVLAGVSLMVATVGGAGSFAQTKTVTNADLEKYRQARFTAEAEYRANAKRLGLPSPEELAAREAERQKRLFEFADQLQAKQAQDEAYWQARASLLKTELAGVDGQIGYLRNLLNSLPQRQTFVGVYYPNNFPQYGLGYGFPQQGYLGGQNSNWSDGNYGNYWGPRPVKSPWPGTRPATGHISAGAPVVVSGGLGYGKRGGGYGGYYNHGVTVSGGGRNWGVVVNIGGGRRGYHNQQWIYYGGYVAPYFINNQSYERQEVAAQLRQLEQARAGLLAQWRTLEDDASRAGVKVN
jgi:hypothetical protein